ncbi:COP9 signalosome subunit 8 (CsnH), putative [Talaromyces stipitatus ATCC 10500]|uniref:COP9 signalosome subunit 8 (CsnH), putative n=1 Tax=Talaromyces stipitatus (strain ATCC 10500 / CBS 375.48 / QM 6759 / NRRL 1006) TaxID=441959 RepID=B8MDZ3_TALSN|nr:COP9 signalosome subunit 8 (CsnH), putative [Talaromyces stipitatus ATCC 10500]EED16070.1 COP9 signalosome subunit 8 (CsnH), putative [Talaromyces stipitatus ATCC 10500]
MDSPSLSLEQLQKVLTDTPTNDALYEILSSYEDEACQQFTAAGEIRNATVLTPFYSSFLFSHLLIDEIQEARALTQRIPTTLIQNDPVVQRSIAVLRSIYQNKYSETYGLLRTQPWPEPVNIIVQRFDSYYTERSFRNISRIYESIRPKVAAEYLGLESNSELMDILVKKGWEWDADKEVFRPRVPEKHIDIGKYRQPLDQISRIVNLASVQGG